LGDTSEHFATLCCDAVKFRDALLASGEEYRSSISFSGIDSRGWLAEEPALSYRTIPEPFIELLDSLVAAHGRQSGERFLQLVMANEILKLPDQLRDVALPASVLPWLERCVVRMLGDLATPRAGYFSLDNDLFLKDLAVCRLKLIPCGVEMVDPEAGFSRSAVWKHGFAVGWNLSRALFDMGGNQPVLLGHIDRRSIREFNAAGYLRFYHVVADILRLRPEIRGLTGQSWLLDPELGKISPELAFLHDVPKAGHAVFFPAVAYEGMVEDAIRMSPVRRKLYEADQYRPCSFNVVWPRRALLRWVAENPSAP
jgi:hypothetical protein